MSGRCTVQMKIFFSHTAGLMSLNVETIPHPEFWWGSRLVLCLNTGLIFRLGFFFFSFRVKEALKNLLLTCVPKTALKEKGCFHLNDSDCVAASGIIGTLLCG